jgi:hypothetical protein
MNVSGVNLDQSMSKTFYAPESPYPVQNPIAAVTNQVTNQVKNIFSTVSNVVKGARNTNRNTDRDDDGYGYDDDDLPQVGEEVEVCDDDDPSVWELGTVESISDTGDVYVRKAGWDEAFVYDSWRFPVTANNDEVEEEEDGDVEEVSASRLKSPSKKDKEKAAKKVSAPIVVRCLLHEDALKEKDKNLTEIGFDVECDRNLPVSVCVCLIYNI